MRGKRVVVRHSLACTTWRQLPAPNRGETADRVVLVAPPGPSAFSWETIAGFSPLNSISENPAPPIQYPGSHATTTTHSPQRAPQKASAGCSDAMSTAWRVPANSQGRRLWSLALDAGVMPRSHHLLDNLQLGQRVLRPASRLTDMPKPSLGLYKSPPAKRLRRRAAQPRNTFAVPPTGASGTLAASNGQP